MNKITPWMAHSPKGLSVGICEFEAGISKNGQTHQPALVSYMLGWNQLIVSFDTMNYPEPLYS